MTSYAKPSVRNAWAETATPADIQDPGNTFAKAGWPLGAKPPRQYMNWVLNYTFAAVRYFCQQGIPTWDSAETYSSGNLVVATDGRIYKSLSSNTNINPATTGPDQVNWDVPWVPTPPNSDRTVRIANTVWVGVNFLPVGSTFGALSGPIQNSQVPVGAVTQWQGSLSIGGGQVTSAVARANAVLNSAGQYATFTYSGQSGQPTWLWGTNDGITYSVWNPANFNVANANTLGGVAPSVPAAGSSIVARDSSGFIYSAYYSQSSANNENPSISQIMVTNGADNFFRKASTSAVKAALGALAVADFPALLSGNGYQKFPTGVILQWGTAFISGTTTVTFPITFPNGIARVAFVNASNTNQLILNGIAGASSFSVTNGSATISWVAMGY